MIKSALKASCLVSFFLLLSACVTPRQTAQLRINPPNIASAHQIKNVPFYPQQEYFCGPTTLAEVFNFYGSNSTPEEIAPRLFIPEMQGSLQIEMIAATRQQGLLAYAEKGNLSQILSLVSQDIPVIVLQNVATDWYPMWHYALVVGYDLTQEKIILRSGITKRWVSEFKVFERTWQRGDYWFMAALPTDIISHSLEPYVYISAAQDLITLGKTKTGISALTSATKQWPDYWLSYFLIANHYLAFDLNKALYWYQLGYTAGKGQPDYLNNFAYALQQSGCQTQAIKTINKAIRLKPNDPNLIESKKELRQTTSQLVCPKLNFSD